jgi:hypothetical protein
MFGRLRQEHVRLIPVYESRESVICYVFTNNGKHRRIETSAEEAHTAAQIIISDVQLTETWYSAPLFQRVYLPTSIHCLMGTELQVCRMPCM